MKHILFITSTNLASNPRCRKEVELALSNGYKVSVIAFLLPNWTQEKELSIQQQLSSVEFHYLPADRSSYTLWMQSLLWEKGARWLYKAGFRSLSVVGSGVSRRAFLIKRTVRRKNIQPDIIIAHNPGAFWPAIAGFAGKPFGIDVEDYHPGEGSDRGLSSLQTDLIKLVLPKAAYVSYASEPIKNKVSLLLPQHNSGPQFVINNFFPRADFPQPAPVQGDERMLQLIWFSQNIDAGRGLEQLLPVLEQFRDRLTLTLVGNSNTGFCRSVVSGKPYVRLIPSMDQTELHKEIGNYDIGLAIEPGKDVNNVLALSNKICTYFQAGLYVIATATEAQQTFIRSFPEHGTVVQLQMEDLADQLERLLEDLSIIRQAKLTRWSAAQQHSWETEHKKLSDQWSQMHQ